MTTAQNKPIPMNSDTTHMMTLEMTAGPVEIQEQKKLQTSVGFKYRNATGELIFAMITCRADIAFAVMKLFQYNNNPATCHYEASCDLYRYLNAIIQDVIMYWHPKPQISLPSFEPSPPHEEPYVLNLHAECKDESTAYAMADSDFDGDRKTRKSVGSTLIFFGSAVIVYKTILQQTIALSSIEAEFYALTEAGKLVLYIQFFLKDLGLQQCAPTTIYEDIKGCLQMTKALKLTEQTRHVETQYFTILEWTQTD